MITGWDALVKYIGMTRETIKRWMIYKDFPLGIPMKRTQCGPRWMWRQVEVDEWLKDNPDVFDGGSGRLSWYTKYGM